MKNLIKISLLLTIFCFAIPVYADGDMTAGNKNCTQNCGGLFDGNTINPTVPDNINQDKSTLAEIFSWISKRVSELID